MNNELIDKRRLEIEAWMNEAVKFPSLTQLIFNFLNISIEGKISRSKKPCLDDMVKEFVNKINSTTTNRMNLIENFEWSFFSNKAAVHPDTISLLLQCLIPLCSDEFIGIKVLDLISKLTTRDYFRDFSVALSTLSSFPPCFLSEMFLNEYLSKRRFGDSQVQAYKIANSLEVGFTKELFQEIVIVT